VNATQYLSLCRACDAVLNAPDASKVTLAIPWLHVIRAHPIFLKNYEDLFGFQSPFGILSHALRLARNLASRVLSLLRALMPESGKLHTSGALPEKVDVLIVSHLLSSTFAGQGEDFYFGELGERLAEKGLSVVFALINYTGVSPATLARSWSGARVTRVILNNSLSFREEVALHQMSRLEAARLRSKSRQQGAAFMRRLLVRAATEAQGGATFHALRLGTQIQQLCQRYSPETVMTTYEGHAWERIAFKSARDGSTRVRCVGYQHAILFNMQHAALRLLRPGFNPDVIATSGLIAKDILKRNPAFQTTIVDVVGSSRVAPFRVDVCAKGTLSNRTCCLVLPEGDDGECYLLFAFALECARSCPGTEFIWRLHPSIVFKNLVAKYHQFRQLPSNVTLSTSSLEQDIARTRWALYRGSTAVITAAAGGAFPIYLERLGELSVDALHGLGGECARVSSVDGFLQVVDENRAPRSASMDKIARHCAQIITPFNSNKFIQMVWATPMEIEHER